MFKKFLPKRFSLLKSFVLIYLLFSFLIRLSFTIWEFDNVDTSFFVLANTFIIGFVFDLGTISFFVLPYTIYLLLVPKTWYGNVFDKSITYFAYGLGLMIFIFSFFAEVTFWDEFKNRFNFIAVDYLVYTNEVIKNINESYPLPILFGFILIILFILFYYTFKKDIFLNTFNNETSFNQKVIPTVFCGIIALIYALFVTNKSAEQFDNRFNNELSKSGIYSFFAAFRSSELPYTKFYRTINEDTAFNIVKQNLSAPNSNYIYPNDNLIYRTIKNSDSINKPIKPNVIFICIESLSGQYLSMLGCERNFTPNLDSIGKNSLFFKNIYATGTRTIRGMEAITLSIPPTPGRSIVKRTNNNNLFSIGEVFKQQGYERYFFYGGDGYFDNMNSYFGGNGFNIVDRGRGFLLDDNITNIRTNIEDNEVSFENAWGVCDGDIYNKVIKEADKNYEKNIPFFDFIMTTSNHRPFTYPDNKVDIPSGKSRAGAIKYTDYAIGEFIKEAKTKPWFENTVFVIMADHCAYSAGRGELDVKNHHIPALIYNAPNIKNNTVDKLCSQIDVFPTLFGILNWDYTSNLFGKDVLSDSYTEERAFIGNYRKLGLLKNGKLMVLSEQKKASFYDWDKNNDNLIPIPIDETFLNEETSFYQVADYLYQNNGLKIK
jgi:phosphoglycerol transferase MdoB-like AlkP superfamily enzyme